MFLNDLAVVCKYFGGLSGECKQLILEYGPLVFDYLASLIVSMIERHFYDSQEFIVYCFFVFWHKFLNYYHSVTPCVLVGKFQPCWIENVYLKRHFICFFFFDGDVSNLGSFWKFARQKRTVVFCFASCVKTVWYFC